MDTSASVEPERPDPTVPQPGDGPFLAMARRMLAEAVARRDEAAVVARYAEARLAESRDRDSNVVRAYAAHALLACQRALADCELSVKEYAAQVERSSVAERHPDLSPEVAEAFADEIDEMDVAGLERRKDGAP